MIGNSQDPQSSQLGFAAGGMPGNSRPTRFTIRVFFWRLVTSRKSCV
jgi:hypothetical protein